MTNKIVEGAISSNGVTTGTGAAVATNEAKLVTVYGEWSAGCSAGQYVIEGARNGDYTGTWVTLATINWSAASKLDIFQSIAGLNAIRTRITVNVVGGTFTSYVDALG